MSAIMLWLSNTYKMKNKKYHTVGTIPKYHTVGTVQKSRKAKNTTLSEQFQNRMKNH